MQPRFKVLQTMEESCMQCQTRARSKPKPKPEFGGRRKSSSSIIESRNTTSLHSPQHLALSCQTTSLSRQNSMPLSEKPARQQKATGKLLLRAQPSSHTSRVSARVRGSCVSPHIPGLQLCSLLKPIQS